MQIKSQIFMYVYIMYENYAIFVLQNIPVVITLYRTVLLLLLEQYLWGKQDRWINRKHKNILAFSNLQLY